MAMAFMQPHWNVPCSKAPLVANAWAPFPVDQFVDYRGHQRILSAIRNDYLGFIQTILDNGCEEFNVPQKFNDYIRLAASLERDNILNSFTVHFCHPPRQPTWYLGRISKALTSPSHYAHSSLKPQSIARLLSIVVHFCEAPRFYIWLPLHDICRRPCLLKHEDGHLEYDLALVSVSSYYKEHFPQRQFLLQPFLARPECHDGPHIPFILTFDLRAWTIHGYDRPMKILMSQKQKRDLEARKREEQLQASNRHRNNPTSTQQQRAAKPRENNHPGDQLGYSKLAEMISVYAEADLNGQLGVMWEPDNLFRRLPNELVEQIDEWVIGAEYRAGRKIDIAALMGRYGFRRKVQGG
ncbi:hypothetical protein HK097_007574 [Rhizophlyctis rosea]|uniref:Uncharacterized protein n=1 Tax=Rhizophlyctis rosea TaxID=64517 RepID=A0AAD5X5D0_9FUNG|nr:hypothetical protein HK097_007574 [Rhizophlyctis rosea]